jgi:hypothetical protein
MIWLQIEKMRLLGLRDGREWVQREQRSGAEDGA